MSQAMEFPKSSCTTIQRWNTLVASFLSYGFDAIDFMILALTMPFIIREYNISLAEAGLLGTAGMIGVGISSVVLGLLSDRKGRKPALMISVLIFGIFTFAIYFSRSWIDILFLRLIAGLGLGGVWGVVSTLISEVWPQRTRGRAVTFVLSAWPLGVITAAAAVAAFLPLHGWRFVYLLGGVAVLLIPYIWIAVPESPAWMAQRSNRSERVSKPKKATVEAIFQGDLRAYTVLGTLASTSGFVAYWGANTWLPTYLVQERGLDSSAMAWYVITLNVGMFVGYQFFGLVADRFGSRTALILSLLGAAIMLPIYAAIRNTTLLFWLGPVTALFFAFPGLFGTYFPRLYPTHIRSLGSGFCFNVGRGLSAFAPFLLGSLATSFGLSIAIGLCGAGFLVAAIVMVFLHDISVNKFAPSESLVSEPGR